jgi:hypothetical protein
MLYHQRENDAAQRIMVLTYTVGRTRQLQTLLFPC